MANVNENFLNLKNDYLFSSITEKRREFEKNKRKFLQEVKMSKEKPTKKQLYYYDRLCKKYSVEKKDVNELSKLDLRDEIEKILNEHSEDYKNID